jgi:hypothetical protein
VKDDLGEMWKERYVALFEEPSWYLALCTEETHDGCELEGHVFRLICQNDKQDS